MREILYDASDPTPEFLDHATFRQSMRTTIGRRHHEVRIDAERRENCGCDIGRTDRVFLDISGEAVGPTVNFPPG